MLLRQLEIITDVCGHLGHCWRHLVIILNVRRSLHEFISEWRRTVMCLWSVSQNVLFPYLKLALNMEIYSKPSCSHLEKTIKLSTQTQKIKTHNDSFLFLIAEALKINEYKAAHQHLFNSAWRHFLSKTVKEVPLSPTPTTSPLTAHHTASLSVEKLSNSSKARILAYKTTHNHLSLKLYNLHHLLFFTFFGKCSS